MTQVALVRTDDRAQGVRRALDILGARDFQGKRLFLKPNFNSADPAPGSTHNDTLRALVEWLRGAGADHITVGDRSGMGDTRGVMEQKSVFQMAEELAFEAVVLDELGAEDWQMFYPDGAHWSEGFALARPIFSADSVVQTCCLKTHRFGGHFTLSLKNSVGMVAKRLPGGGRNYMTELHNSTHQRHMIAEINAVYRPDLIVLDGVEAFVNGGPDRGKQVHAGVVLAGMDRVAVDAVGVALLRYIGTTPEVSQGPIFGLEQIARAVELGVGVGRPSGIQLVADGPGSDEMANELRAILDQG